MRVNRIVINQILGIDHLEIEPNSVTEISGSNGRGIDREEDDAPIEYTFNSEAEMEAFLHGVDEACGWLAYEIMQPHVCDDDCRSNGYETRRDS